MILTPRKREHIMPLPVALIPTIYQDGIRNAAPWSNITPILRPLDEIIMASWIKRDTLENIRQTGEFVINIPPVGMIEQVIICSKNFPPNVDKFEAANLMPTPSQKVKAPRIEGSLAWAECALVEEISRPKYSLIIGRVALLEGNDCFFNENGEINFEEAKPLSVMLGEGEMYFTYPAFSGINAKYSDMFLNKQE